MAGKASLSKPGIRKDFGLAETTLAFLEDLELFDPSKSKVIRGERRYPVSAAQKEIFQLARAHYPSLRSAKLPMFPYQRAIVFYLLASGPEAAFNILVERGFVVGDRPNMEYFTALHNKLIDRAPKGIKKWVKGEQEVPTDANRKEVDLYLDILGLADFWDDPDQMELSFLYDDIVVRTSLEGLLCTQAKYDEIAEILSAQFDMDIDQLDVEIYHKFYFDRDILSSADWSLWVDGLGINHKGHLTGSLNLTLSEYVRKHRIARKLDTVEELDAMLSVSQQGFWSHKDAANLGSLDAIKKQQILVQNSLKLFEARSTLAPTGVGTVNDRLKLEFEEPKNLRIVNREDFDPEIIDPPTVAKSAGLSDTSAKKQQGA